MCRVSKDNKFYKNGILNKEYLCKNICYFRSHPEQIKQKLKQKDANRLCQFFDSEEYKRRVSQFLELQGKLLSQEAVSNNGAIKYQHVLSCAQPSSKSTKVFVEEEPAPEIKLGNYIKKRKVRKSTVFAQMLKKKDGDVDEALDEGNVNEESENVQAKKFRTRSTIMPIFLKKLREKRPGMDWSGHNEEPSNSHGQTARRIKKFSDGDTAPMYSKMLHKSNVYKKRKPKTTETDDSTAGTSSAFPSITSTGYNLAGTSKKMRLNNSKADARIDPIASDSLINSIRKDNIYQLSGKANSEVPIKLSGPSGVTSLRMASSTAKIASRNPTTKLYPKKFMNLKTYSDFLDVEPIKMRKSKTVKRPKSEGTIEIKVLNSDNTLKKCKSKKNDAFLEMLMERVKDKKSLEDYKLEKQNTLLQIKKNQKEAKKQKQNGRLELTSLFKRVKSDNLKIAKLEVLTTNGMRPEKISEVIIKPKIVHREAPKSFTYKCVTKDRERREERLRQNFAVNPPYWKKKFNFTFEKPIDQINKEIACNNLNSDKSDFGKKKITRKLNDILQKNLSTNLHKPLPHFVEHADKPKTYLIRLPKTTPEGYRVLLYGVRDPDPTKMNFNDVVKGFCMYNDCVLSEDGLQEGYVVIFDMKDVSLGHLARVSLPALKCFMCYIQEAHPCRLKQIHVLNTASWIHHIMRLIVPLVRSELLNLVKFHKGNIPDGIPQELLPKEYGGESATIDELDRATKSLLDKYHDWLIESGQFKSDESKRTRKSGWWGFFSSKSPQQVELDEKTILRNLQID